MFYNIQYSPKKKTIYFCSPNNRTIFASSTKKQTKPVDIKRKHRLLKVTHTYFTDKYSR